MGTSEDRARPFPWLFAVLLVTFAVFAPSIGNGFTYDDPWVAMGHDGNRPNEMVGELQPLSEYFTSHYWRGTSDTGNLYRPLTILSFALRHAVAGDNAQAAHLINVLLHVLATALVCTLVRGLRQPPRVAAFAALVFGLHAIHSEVVAAVVGRAELLAFCFGATGALAWTRSHGRTGIARAGWLGTAAASLFLAFSSKESALAWLPVIGCYGLARRWVHPPDALPQRTRAALAVDAAVLAAPALVFLALRAQMLASMPDATWHTEFIVNPLFDAPAQTRILTATTAWGFGLALTLFPWFLSADWGWAVLPVVDSFTEPAALLTLLAATALLGTLGAGLWRAPRRPLLFFGIATFFGTSILASNLVAPIGTLFAERLYYTPSLALAFVAAAVATRLRPEHLPVALLLAGTWLGASASEILERNGVWRDTQTLVLHEAREQPSSVRMRSHAALILLGRGDTSGAITHLEHAVDLDPGFVNGWHRLGDLYAARDDSVQARACYRAALAGRHAELAGAVEPEIRSKLDALPAASPGR